MAERRMFAKTIIDSDAFLDMPHSSQLLYFHLSMRGDDDGFINNPKSVMRNVKCSDDDLKLLIAKKFIIPFESGVVVIKHWKIHNYIRGDRYSETKYQNEKSLLHLDENNAYSINSNNRLTCGIPLVDQRLTQVRLGKDSIDKDNINTLSENSDGVNVFDERFERFSKSYPKKIGKGAAEKSFKKIKPSESLLENMLVSIGRFRQTDQWKKDNGQFIPNPATWLNQKRWEDDISVEVEQAKESFAAYDINSIEQMLNADYE